tara:strand:- start:939 stop:1826 length:888 start_codon:yes stop_codon:yes gene_type:complete
MIKAFMFHDIRNHDDTKYINRYKLKSFMTVDEFKDKLDYLIEEYNIISSSEIPSLKISNGKHAVLTFDDGLKDHYHVAEILSDLGLPGTFLIPTQAVRDRVIMNTHKIQFILASINEKELVKLILDLTPLDVSDKHLWDKYSVSKWKDNWWTPEMVFVTNILRYYDNGDITNKLFNSLVTRDETAFCNDFYLNEKQIYEMVKGGHEIGGHGFVSSPLTTIPNQKNDIIQSLDYVKKFYNENIVFSYPNGDYNHDTLDILKDYGCKYAFTTVKQKLNINTSMLEIPRYDASQDLTI